jgi:hypothetical protein
LAKEAFPTKKARYEGDHAVDLPTLGIRVEPGDVIDVPDEFSNSLFVEVKSQESKKTAKESDSE